MVESIKIWWKSVVKKGKVKYSIEVLPSILLTSLSFVVVSNDVVGFLNKYFIFFIIFIFIILILNSIGEVNRAVEINNINLSGEKKDGKILRLEDELELLKQALQSLPTDLLHDFSDMLNLDNSTRITFYLYKESKFINIGRHSKNSKFVKTKFGNTFELHDNYISKCFHSENEDFFIKDTLPNPYTDFDKYYQEIRKDFKNFKKKELEKVTMKSRCYFGKKIYGYDRNPIGVLMIESTKENLSIMLDGSQESLCKKEDYKLLSELIDQKFQFILQSIHKNLRYYYKGVE